MQIFISIVVVTLLFGIVLYFLYVSTMIYIYKRDVEQFDRLYKAGLRESVFIRYPEQIKRRLPKERWWMT